MRQSFIIILMFLSYFCFGQIDKAKTLSLEILPEKNTDEIDIKPITERELPSLSDFEKDIASPSFAKPNNKSIFEKPKFQIPNEDITNRLKKEFKREDDFNIKEFQRNQYFGDFKTNSEYARIIYRDHLAFDGDRVRIVVNGNITHQDVLLEPNYKQLDVHLAEGFNKIEIIALNQGSSGPNTAEFQVYDDNGTLINSNQWELATGYKGTIILTKE
ncbi:MAG: hypothetical protein Q4B43_06040 [Bacteroidota bacterium]|nr:hypothetical protein [Bacteroidota bacterium]